MAKKRTDEQPDAPAAEEGSESIAGYFRKIFEMQPHLLGVRSNKKILKLWLADHPGHTEVPQSVKNSLANLKSSLRSKKRKRRARRADQVESNGVPILVATPVLREVAGNALEELELQIDECLTLARQIDRDSLGEVIGFLRTRAMPSCGNLVKLSGFAAT